MIIKMTVRRLNAKLRPMVNFRTIKSKVTGEKPMCTLFRTRDLTGLSGRVFIRIYPMISPETMPIMSPQVKRV